MNAGNIKTIIIAIAVIVVAIIIYQIVKNNNSGGRTDEQEAVACDNKTIYRYKYPSEAFPVFARDYNTEVSLTSDVLQILTDSLGSGEIGVDIKNKVVELQENLNQDNITFSAALRSYFINSNSDPCNDTLRQRFLAFTEEMTRRMPELRNTTAQVTTITQKGNSGNGTSSANNTDTTIQRPKFSIAKDSASIRKSIYKLDEILQTSNKANRKLNVVPAAAKVQLVRPGGN